MDHLPHPQKENTVPLPVPFLCQPGQPDYSKPGKHEYFPDDDKYFPGADFSDRTAEEITSFAQTFLYFGLLSDVLREWVDPVTLVTRTVSDDGTIKKTLS